MDALTQPIPKPGVDFIPASGKIYGQLEFDHLHKVVDEAHWTEGKWTDRFEDAFAKRLGVRYASLCNSGSSANLLAVAAMTSKRIPADKRWRPGDEVITAAVGFPTTVNPLILLGLKPVLVDSDPPTYVPTAQAVEEAISPRTRGIFLAHTLGNPVPLDEIRLICETHGLTLIEDNCDALGSAFYDRLNERIQLTGTWGAMATQSFYPAHHITTGEGGMVITNSARLRKIVESFRDWGRDCWCEPGCENTCKRRYDWAFENLPPGYDHKYIYSHIGFNLKGTDFMAALGVAQMTRLPFIMAQRNLNFSRLHDRLSDLQEFFILPEVTPYGMPCWFGFPLTIRPETSIQRVDLLRRLEARKIGSRLIFGGNLTRQPAYKEVLPKKDLPGADLITENSFWVGIWPGLDKTHMDYIADTLREFVYEN